MKNQQVMVERKGIEPSTFALRTRLHRIKSTTYCASGDQESAESGGPGARIGHGMLVQPGEPSDVPASLYLDPCLTPAQAPAWLPGVRLRSPSCSWPWDGDGRDHVRHWAAVDAAVEQFIEITPELPLAGDNREPPGPDPRSAAGLRGWLFSGPLHFAQPPYIPEADPDRPGLPPVAVPRTYTIRLKRRPWWHVLRVCWRQGRLVGLSRGESLRHALAQAFGWSWLLPRPERVREELRRYREGSSHG